MRGVGRGGDKERGQASSFLDLKLQTKEPGTGVGRDLLRPARRSVEGSFTKKKKSELRGREEGVEGAQRTRGGSTRGGSSTPPPFVLELVNRTEHLLASLQLSFRDSYFSKSGMKDHKAAIASGRRQR